MNEFGYIMPTEIQFGEGVVQGIGEIIRDRGFEKPMIVTDKGIVAAGLIEGIQKSIEEAGFDCILYDEVIPNPRDKDCDKGAAFALEKGVDVLIAVGGGSAMDTAKAMATVMTNGKTSRDWMDVELDEQITPVICIPTTCGTGSEVTFNAVIINTETRLKGNIFDPKCAPILALVDPLMIKNLPAGLVSSTGIDALTHAIEAYVSTVATPITDMISIKAVQMIADNIVAATKGDMEARAEVLLASCYAGIAFGNADTAAVHCISECFGGFYDMPHGVTNSIFLPTVSEYSIPGNPKKYADCAAAMGCDISGLTDEEAAMKGVEKIKELCAEIGIPKLSSFTEVDPKDFDYLAQASSEHVCNPSNPIEFTAEQYKEIFEKVMAE
ncbi:MAG: iron-containing alcohol dehydrogenase [Firmicutes bacterium]|nr:iron-containing alcohol dehydrogenase [Bacillota bacterium]